MKHFITSAGLIAGIAISYISIMYLVFGFIIAKYGGGKEEGLPGKIRSIVIPLGSYRVHLHHWLLFSLLMFAGMAENIFHFVSPEVFYGILCGLAWQGIYCYNDWYRVVYKTQTNH